MKSPDTPFQLAWIVTNACNLRCLHCFYDCTNVPDADELSLKDSKELLARLRSANQIGILFMGGEPFLRSDFVELLALATRWFCCQVYTNGTLISEDIASSLRDARVNAVFINLLGATAATHDYLTGVVGSFERTVEAIRTLVRMKVRVIVTTVLMKPNIPEIPHIVELSISLGASKCNFLRFFPLGRGKNNREILEPHRKQLQDTIEQINLLSAQMPIEVSHPYFPRIHNCCKLVYTICPNGDVASCSYLRNFQRFGNLIEQDVAEVWRSDRFRAHREIAPKGRCQTCPYFANCGGGCRASAYLETNQWDAPDPFCFFQPEGRESGIA